MQYKRSDNVVARSVAGEHVLIPVHGCTRSVYTLNAAGVILWEALATPQRECELVLVLAEHYEIAPEVAQRDVAGFLADLVRMQLIAGVDSPL